MFENKTDNNIRKDMLSKVSSPVSKTEGTLIYDSLSPVANELAKVYIELDSILLKAFLHTSYGEWLDKKAAEFGVYRKIATKATGTVRFTGNSGAGIPKGFLVAKSDGLQYETIYDVTIGSIGYVDVGIVAVETGSAYNALEGEVTVMRTVSGLETVSNITIVSGGADGEDDDTLRQRALDKVRNKGTSGNIKHYKEWALEVDGVGDARVFPNENGPGTVGVYLIDDNGEPCNTEIINNTKANIEANRPIGATVSVKPMGAYDITVRATVKIEDTVTYAEVKASIEANIRAVIREAAFEGIAVSSAKITNAVMTSKGVLDCTQLLVNGSSGVNINIPSKYVPVFNSLSVFYV